jgi:hypothetical protein
MKSVGRLSAFFITMAVLSLTPFGTLSAQDFIGVSAGYETFSSAKLRNPIAGSEGFEVQTSSWNIGLAYPWKFADGQILMLSKVAYKRLEFTYKDLPPGPADLTQAQSIQLSVFMIDSLTERWSLVAALTPGLASDFERRMTMDDFTLQAMLGFIRKYGTDFQLGFGLAYTRDFGSPMPLPFLYLDWKITPQLSFNGIVPVNLYLRYAFHPMLDLGMAVRVRGDRYHGDPGKYGVNNPQMEYSEATLSPSVRIHFSEWVHLNVEGGFAFYRNFEFLDGDRTASSYDLEPSGYFRAEFVLGI